MAYLKYKEITKYFHFFKELNREELPSYVTDYLDEGEEVLSGYATKRDKGLFTNKKILLFDVTPYTNTKQIHTIPYNSISSIGVLFGSTNGAFIIYLESGYPLELKFKNLNGEKKTRLRLLYSAIAEIVANKKQS